MLNDLEESRGKFVRQLGGKAWLGSWYRREDWDKDGNLIATGEARARAVDPWANDRAAGRPCPPLGSPGSPHWADYVRETETRETETGDDESHAESQPWVAAGVSRATWFRRKGNSEAKD